MTRRSTSMVLGIGLFLFLGMASAQVAESDVERAQRELQRYFSPQVVRKGSIIKLRNHSRPIVVENNVTSRVGAGATLSTSLAATSTTGDVEYIEPNYFFERLIPDQKFIRLYQQARAASGEVNQNVDYSKEPRVKLQKFKSSLELGETVVFDASRSFTLDDSPMEFRWSVTAPDAQAGVTLSRDSVLRFTPDQRGTYVVSLTISNPSFPDLEEALGALRELLGLLGSVQRRFYSEVSFTIDVSQFNAHVVSTLRDPPVLLTELGKTVKLNASLSEPHPQFNKTGMLDHLWKIPDFMFFNLAAPYSNFRKFDTNPYLPLVYFTPDALGGFIVQDEIIDEFGVRQTLSLIVDVSKNEELKALPYDPNLPDQHKGFLYQHNLMKTYDAWKEIDFSKTAPVVVAVIDTGVNINHPDLNKNIWVNQKELNGKPGVDDDQNGYIDDLNGWDFVHNDNSPFDDGHHGSHVSGIIAAVTGNGGVVGVAPNVKIMPLKGLYGYGSGELDDLINAIYYAADNGAHVINASWGGQMEELAESRALREAILYATNRGVLFVAASGNEALDNDQIPMMPASYDVDGIVSVAATDQEDNLASFSNVGIQSVDLAAPGVNIASSISWNPQGGQYELMSGTSMATPMVAGLAALLKSVDPKLTHRQLKKVLMDSGDPLQVLRGRVQSGKRVNTLKALRAVQGEPRAAVEEVHSEEGAPAAPANAAIEEPEFRIE